MPRGWARETGVDAPIALRYHNVYGPGMPRDTPYAGVAAIFRSAIENGARAAGFRGRRPACATSFTSSDVAARQRRRAGCA